MKARVFKELLKSIEQARNIHKTISGKIPYGHASSKVDSKNFTRYKVKEK